jgi:hypothetical protein
MCSENTRTFYYPMQFDLVFCFDMTDPSNQNVSKSDFACNELHTHSSLHHKLHFDTSLVSVPLLVDLEILLIVILQIFAISSENKFLRKVMIYDKDFHYFPFGCCNKSRLMPNTVFYFLWIL